MSVYDQMIEEVIKMQPLQMQSTWAESHKRLHGELFAYCSPGRGFMSCRPDNKVCGCLTQIRASHWFEDPPRKFAWTDELTKLIAEDDRLPSDMGDLVRKWPGMSADERRATLIPLAEWQERLDKELNRTTPVFGQFNNPH
jgi:ribosomal protein L24E